MRSSSRSLKGLATFVFLICLTLISSTAQGQISLVSVSPVDGTVDVDTSATLQLVFSGAIDTTARFDEPGDFFLSLLVIPEDSVGEPDSIAVSSDMRTVTVMGLPLTPNTTFHFVLMAVRGQGGEALDHPTAITLTTGSSLPTGTISGDISFTGNDPAGTLVAVFDSLFSGDPMAVGVSASPYQVNYVPDGDFTVIALQDFDGDGNVDFGGPDALGFYDPGGDGIPDTVSVTGGGSVTNIDISLCLPIARTARSSLTLADLFVKQFLPDAQAAALFSAGNVVSTDDGTSYMWFHEFFSPNDSVMVSIIQFSDKALLSATVDSLDTLVMALPPEWVDSDAAIDTAEANGGFEYRQSNPDPEINVGLFPGEPPFGPNGDPPPGKAAVMSDERIQRSRPLRLARSAYGLRAQSDGAFWSVNYFTRFAEESFFILIDAITGRPIVFNPGTTSARMNQAGADVAAMAWAQDAVLVAVHTASPDIDPGGFATFWEFVYYSPGMNAAHSFFMFGGQVQSDSNLPLPILSQEKLPDAWIDSQTAMAIAEPLSNDFRETHFFHGVEAWLSRNIVEASTDAYWCIMYVDFFFPDTVSVYVDALTGAVVTGVGEEQADLLLPALYDLQQNYPNPFNPETVIKFQLPQSDNVRLVVYNPLGQTVRVLLDGRHEAGEHTVAWDGLDSGGHQVPNGVYFYKLISGDFTETRKMAVLR